MPSNSIKIPRFGRRLSVLATGLFLATTAWAETLSISCTENDADGHPMILTYDGDASGTLHVEASFGIAELPASKETRTDESDGSSVTGIRAFGRATVTMPDPGAIEACVREKARGDEIEDEDIVTMLLDSCRTAVANSAPTDIDMTVEVAIIEPPGAEVYLIRKFLDESSLPVGRIAIESLPPPTCRVGP